MLLEITHVSKSYSGANRTVHALDDVSLTVAAGEFVAVQGPSGCGKSTLLLIAGGLLVPERGRVSVEGEFPYDLPADARARLRGAKIGFVFQQFHLVSYLTVFDNVRAAALATGAADADARARELIGHFGLQDRLHHVPGQLSTGERQRTALARALLNRPKLLLADEPTGNLDRENAKTVLQFLSEFASNGGGVLLVTHDEHAVTYAQRNLRLRDGRMQEGQRTFSNPDL